MMDNTQSSKTPLRIWAFVFSISNQNHPLPFILMITHKGKDAFGILQYIVLNLR